MEVSIGGIGSRSYGLFEKISTREEEKKWFVRFLNATFIVGRKKFNYDGALFGSSFKVKICPITLKICRIEGESKADLFNGFTIEKSEKIICSEKFSCLNLSCPLVDKGKSLKHMRSKFRLVDAEDVELFLEMLKTLNNFIKAHIDEIREGNSFFLLSEVLTK